jgi:hypothetical protein
VHQPLLLISQVQRSGGTLLSQLLDGHPQLFVHPFELKWTEPKWGWPLLEDASPLATLRALDEDWLGAQAPRGFYTKGREHNPERALDSGRQPFLFDRRLQLDIFLAAAPSAPQHSRRATFDAYFTAFFNAWLDYTGLVAPRKRWVAAFVPRLAQTPGSLDGYFSDYPDGLLVSSVRDPVGWLASARRHGMADPAGLEATLGLWLDSTRAAMDAKDRFPGKVHLLLFEDLVTNVDAAMKRLCDAAGIEFDPILLSPTFNGRAMASNSSFVPADFVDDQVPERSRSNLTDEEQSAVERIAGALYREACALAV